MGLISNLRQLRPIVAGDKPLAGAIPAAQRGHMPSSEGNSMGISRRTTRWRDTVIGVLLQLGERAENMGQPSRHSRL